MSERTLVLKILGDAGSAIKSMLETGKAGGILQGKLGGLGGAGALAGAGVAAGAFAAGKALFDIGEQFDAAYDHIRVGTGKTGAALAGLKNDFKAVVKDVPTDFESASSAVAFVAQKMDATGKVGRGLSEQFLELSRITGTDLTTNMQSGSDALAAFNIPASEAGPMLDDIFKASQKSGVGFGDLSSQVAGAATTLKPLGFTFGETTALVAALGKEGLSTSDVIPGLGKAMAKAAKDGVPAKDFLAKFIADIKGAKTPLEAAHIGFETLGAKAGPKFAALIRDGKLSYEQMLQTITGKGGDSIRKAATDTQDLHEKWIKFKNQALLAIEPVATKVFNLVGGLADKFSNLSPGMQKAIIIGAGIVLMLGGIAAAVAVLGPVFAAVGAVIAGALAIITSPITLVVVAVAALAFAVYKNWGTIKDIFSGAVGWVRQHMGEIGRILLAFATGGMSEVVRFVAGHFDDIVGFVKGMPGKIRSAASGMWDGISHAFKAAINFIIRGWNGLQFKIPGFGVGPVHFAGFTLGVPDIPLLAKGGTATSPGWSIVGDRGPELEYLQQGASIVPLDRALGARNNDEDSRPLIVILELDGREVARATAPHTRTELLRIGMRNGSLGFT